MEPDIEPHSSMKSGSSTYKLRNVLQLEKLRSSVLSRSEELMMFHGRSTSSPELESKWSLPAIKVSFLCLPAFPTERSLYSPWKGKAHKVWLSHEF